jgi:hypothetical protein
MLNQQSAQTASRREAKSPLNVQRTMSLLFFLYLSRYLYDIRRRGRFMFSFQRQPSGAPVSDPCIDRVRGSQSPLWKSPSTWELSGVTGMKHTLRFSAWSNDNIDVIVVFDRFFSVHWKCRAISLDNAQYILLKLDFICQ